MAEEQSGSPPSGADVESALERFRMLATRTQNPVYAWIALEYLFTMRSAHGLGGEWPPEQDFILPGWIATYLAGASKVIGDLACGYDSRVCPAEPEIPFVATAGTTPEEIFKSEQFRALVEAHKISAPDALAAVPAALGLTRETGRWNAFGSFRATTAKMHEFRSYQAMTEAGVPAKQAIHAIGEALGISDTSSVYTRLRDGKTAAVED